MRVAVIFGGTGFIGVFFAQHLLEFCSFNKIYLVDIELLEDKISVFRKQQVCRDSRIVVIPADVRNQIDETMVTEEVTLIANFAAVHREPGHESFEYYDTNLMGAEYVCEFAEKINCKNIIFTSSISPYGSSESAKDEHSSPAPVTAYGCSKLIAEKIHRIWQGRDGTNRRLIIVRPGVVFGPGEGGNVSRLIKAVLRRYFFYMGNEHTRKAGIYVKELCNAMWWVYQRQKTSGEHVILFNMSMSPGPSIKDYVDSVCSVAGVKRFVPHIPFLILLTIAYVIDFIARPLKITHPFSPVRITKLVRSNNIMPKYLIDNDYQYRYTLEEAFSDWMHCCPEEWK